MTTMEVGRRHAAAELLPDAAGHASGDIEESPRQADEDAARAENDGYPLGRRGDDGADQSTSVGPGPPPAPIGLEAREAALEGVGCILRLAILGSKATSGPESAGWFRRITLPYGEAAWGRGPSEEEARRRSVERAEARLAITLGE